VPITNSTDRFDSEIAVCSSTVSFGSRRPSTAGGVCSTWNCTFDSLASSGEFVGDVAGSVRLLAQKEVKLPASGIERALLQFFRFESVDERATFIIDPVVQNSLDAFPS